MATKLLDFIYATMYKRINNPDSPYWLPSVLKEVRAPDGRSLHLLKIPMWDIGQLTGAEGAAIGDNISTQWWTQVVAAFEDARDRGVRDLPSTGAFTHQRDAEHPCPVLSLSDLTVDGLPNASVGELHNLTPTNTGYRGTIRVTTAAYDTHGWRQQITIKGKYSLVQHVVAIDRPGTGNGAREDLKPPTKTEINGLQGVEWPRQRIEGHGHFALTVKDLAFDVVLRAEVAGTGADRALQLAVESITLASQPGFHLSEDSLTIEDSKLDPDLLDVWKQSAAGAFNHRDARKALTEKLVGTLAEAAFRDELSATATTQLAKALDGVLGAVPHGGLPHDDSRFPARYGPLEVYLFDRLRASVNDPDSGFYPPTVVLGATNPALEPYDIGHIDLGTHKLGVAPVTLTFKDIRIKGISNVLVPTGDTALTDEGLAATLRFGRLPGDTKTPPPPLTITATGVLSFPDSTDVIEGDITATANQPSATVDLSFTGHDADDLNVGLNSLNLTLATNDLHVTLHLKEPSFWDKAAQKILNQDETKQKIVEGVQTAADAHRADIAQQITENARAVIHAKLKS
ncbi:hypothetical protein ACF08M_05840 [Streptomyces sp. NPDC015032]|uniref:hypothetical protein n=1 Tax=Streptomyces sp. NPDC015032 TaxID=3364937 RepID=UPI003700A746